jgi:hypothetical protein
MRVIVIKYSHFIFVFRTKSLSLNSQMSSLPCASRTTSLNFWFSQYLSSSPGEKSACTRPDQILWSSLEVGRSRSFSRYFSFPWLQLKLIEVAVQSWNSTKCIWRQQKFDQKSMTFYWQKFDKIPSNKCKFDYFFFFFNFFENISISILKKRTLINALQALHQNFVFLFLTVGSQGSWHMCEINSWIEPLQCRLLWEHLSSLILQFNISVICQTTIKTLCFHPL